MTPATPCIVCHKTLTNVFDDADNQPNDGVMCTTNGNYGSTVYDPMEANATLQFNVCDECLVAAGERGEVLEVHRYTKAPEYLFKQWRNT